MIRLRYFCPYVTLVNEILNDCLHSARDTTNKTQCPSIKDVAHGRFIGQYIRYCSCISGLYSASDMSHGKSVTKRFLMCQIRNQREREREREIAHMVGQLAKQRYSIGYTVGQLGNKIQQMQYKVSLPYSIRHLPDPPTKQRWSPPWLTLAFFLSGFQLNAVINIDINNGK